MIPTECEGFLLAAAGISQDSEEIAELDAVLGNGLSVFLAGVALLKQKLELGRRDKLSNGSRRSLVPGKARECGEMAGLDRGLEHIIEHDEIDLNRADGTGLVCLAGQGEPSEPILAVAFDDGRGDAIQANASQESAPFLKDRAFLALSGLIL
jgi:hypothetical protein